MKMEVKVDTNQHVRTLTHSLNEMRGPKEHCDFIIRVGSEEIFAHKNVLCAGSDYFKAMFSHDTKENQTGVTEIKEAEPTCVRKCIDFIYTGIPPKLEDDLEPLMYVAYLMQLTKLCKGFAELLDENLRPETFFRTQKLADLYDLKRLVKKCDDFALANFAEISKAEGFVHFDKNYIKKLLKSKSGTISEESKLDAILRWVKFDSERREKCMGELLKFISLSGVPVAYLRQLLENESLINSNVNLLKMFSLNVVDRVTAELEICKVPLKQDHIIIFDKNSGYLQKFNQIENTLEQMQKMNDDMIKSCFTAACVDEYIYVLMQNKSVYRLLYSDKEAAWEQMENFADDHGWCPPAVALQNYIYVIGGHGDCSTKSVEIFDTRSNKWTKLPDKLRASMSSEPFILNGKIYCCGGYVEEQRCNVVEVFDPINLSWTTATPMNESKACVAAIAFEGKLYVLGGFNSDYLTTVETFDPESDHWDYFQFLKTPRSWFRSFEIHGEIYAVGGYNSSSSSIEKYSFETKDWQDVEIPGDEKLWIVESVKVKL